MQTWLHLHEIIADSHANFFYGFPAAFDFRYNVATQLTTLLHFCTDEYNIVFI